MSCETYYGVITKVQDICVDDYGNEYQEILFYQIHPDRQINGRIVSVRLLHSFVDGIFDMIICQNYRIYPESWRGKIRLERDSHTFVEHVGNQSCQYFADQAMYDRLLKYQTMQRKIERSQSRIDQYFRRI